MARNTSRAVVTTSVPTTTDETVPLDGKAYASLQAARDAGAPTLNYGVFINTIITFLVIALVVFLLVKQVNRMKEKEVAAPVAEKECPFCFTSIPIKATRCPNCTSELKAS